MTGAGPLDARTAGSVAVRPAAPGDIPEWMRLRALLWPDVGEESADEVAGILARAAAPTGQPGDWAAWVLDRGDGRLGGFLEASVRAYAEGCASPRVGFVEGWYVDPDLRRRGLGAELVRAAEQWACGLGLTEMASDLLIDNDVSLAAHLALGYEEVERLICLRKDL